MANESLKQPALLEEMAGWELATFVGLLTYLCTIGFERGIALYWGFPPELITFTFENAFGAFLPAIGCGLFAVMILDVAGDTSHKKAPRVFFGIGVGVLLAFFGYGLFQLAQKFEWSRLLFFSSLGATLLALSTLLLRSARAEWIPRPLLVYIALSCSLPWCAFGVGYGIETNRTRFTVIEGETERLVVLRSYGSSYVCAPLPAGAAPLGDRFHVVTLGDNAALTVHQQECKLTPAGQQSP